MRKGDASIPEMKRTDQGSSLESVERCVLLPAALHLDWPASPFTQNGSPNHLACCRAIHSIMMARYPLAHVRDGRPLAPSSNQIPYLGISQWYGPRFFVGSALPLPSKFPTVSGQISKVGSFEFEVLLLLLPLLFPLPLVNITITTPFLFPSSL